MPAGSRIKVLRVEGNRVTVRTVDEATTATTNATGGEAHGLAASDDSADSGREET